MSESNSGGAARWEKIDALLNVAKFNPKFTILIVGLGLGAAVFEGVGMGFILPVLELVQSDNPSTEAGGILAVFIRIYASFGIPFTLGYVVVGVAAVMTVRYSLSFLVGWFREALRTYYMRDLQVRAFDRAMNARIEYFDQEGSDEVLNAIITQTFYAGRVIERVTKFLEKLFLATVYLSIAFLITPTLTFISILVLGGLTILMRYVLEPGYALGDEVAEANERRQEAAQAGTQGIRDVRIFGIANELFDEFIAAVDQYTTARISMRRNEVAIKEAYNLSVAIFIFVLIYISVSLVDLSIGSLALFLFAMFRLGPYVSSLNQFYYQIENDLPHLVRTQQFVKELEQYEESSDATQDAPPTIDHIEFDDVWFSYDGEEDVLRGVSFEVDRGEFVAFVGQSGAGKSTVVSALARMYEHDEGEIRANGIPITKIALPEWRDKITIVRQDPYIFNSTLEYNLTIGNRDASEAEIRRVCEIAKVDEFVDDLSNGYQTQVGDGGVQLSGGQKQRVALARSLLEDAEILILDEATSDLDSRLEKEVQQAIEEMEQEYTILAIAHRLSTVENADTVYTIADGRIVERGTHDDLLASDGKYAELYAIQS